MAVQGGAALVLLLVACRPAPAQRLARTREIAAGKFLVASRELADPNFADTVVLLARYDEKGAMGLVINRPTRFPVARVFPELKAARGRTDNAFLGGPVERTLVMGLERSRTKIEEAQRLFADVYLLDSKPLLEKAVNTGAAPSQIRVYLGYAGWGPHQLEHEVEVGGWHIFPADPAAVFDDAPQSVWPRLIRLTEVQIARAGFLP